MRKKIFAAMIVAVIAIFAGYNIFQSQRAENTMSDLAMANVEALAFGEDNTGEDVDCFKNISSPTEDEYHNDPSLYATVTSCSPCGLLVIVKSASDQSNCKK